MASKWNTRVAPSRVEAFTKRNRKDYSIYLTYFMMCCGALPGTAIDVCGRRLRVLFNVLNVLGLLIVAARLVAAVSTGWRASQTDSLEALIFKGNFLLWKIMVALEAYALAFTSYKLSRAYHSSYDAAVDYMEELGIEIDWKGERKMQTILIIIACLIGISMNSATMSTYDSIDPFFGNILQNRTTPQAFSALYVFGWPTLVLYTIYHVAFIAYFASTACHITVLLDSFNKKLSSEFESSTCKILSDIRRYRKAHSLLSKVIREADNKFSLSSGIILLVSTVLEFLIIYILASRTRTVSEVLSISIWIMAAAGAISVIIFIGHSVRKKISQPMEFLLLLDDPDRRVDSSDVCQIYLFMKSCESPACLTASGLMDVDKDLGITLVSVIISYTIFMTQLN